MQPSKFRVLSAATAGSLAVAVLVAVTAGSGAGPTGLAAQTESVASVNLNDCPILHTGYPQGGCVAQLQADLNSVLGTHLVVDGIFGSVNSQTYDEVIAFQQAHDLKPDGLVGPATKQALEAALPASTPAAPSATTQAPSTQAPSTQAPALEYVAMGDSYSAGEGLAPFLPGTDTPTDNCHRSDQAYSQYVTPQPGVFVACSGQSTAAITNPVMSGQEQAQDSALNQDTGLVTFTFGGNDADWYDALLDCAKVQTAVLHTTVYGNPAECDQQLSELPGRIETMEQNLLAAYTTVLGLAPNAQVRVLNYPPLFPDRGGSTSGCRIGRFASFQVVIAHDVEEQFVAMEQQANADIADAVSQVQANAPGGDRLQLVDVDPQFGGYTGHTISCGDTGRPTPWINALRMSSSQAAALAADAASGNTNQLSADFADIFAASFHPTQQGQYEMYLALSAGLPSGWH